MSLPLANPSGALPVGTNLIFNGKYILNSLQLVPDGTAAATLIAYDNIVGSGKVLAVLQAPASSVVVVGQAFSRGVKCEIGLTIVVAGGTAVGYATTGAA